MGSEGRPSARAGGEPTSQGCEAGLETRTHTGEAVPCHLVCMQVGKPGRPSGCFGRDGEYALNKSNRIPARGKSCFDGYAAVAVERMRLGNIRSAYAICLGCCCCPPMQGLIMARCEECRCLAGLRAGQHGNFPRHFHTHPWLYSDVSRVCVARTWGPFS